MGVAERFNKGFVKFTVDFGEEGKVVLAFDKTQVGSELEAGEILVEYSEAYISNAFNGAFEDYLQSKGIDYEVLDRS